MLRANLKNALRVWSAVGGSMNWALHFPYIAAYVGVLLLLTLPALWVLVRLVPGAGYELVLLPILPLNNVGLARLLERFDRVVVHSERGRETLRHGPMKPMGLPDPRTGKIPYAVVQLRQDDLAREHYNIVGFQTKLKVGEQQRIFRKIPGLENAVFARYGMLHRNTYIRAPAHLGAVDHHGPRTRRDHAATLEWLRQDRRSDSRRGRVAAAWKASRARSKGRL